MSIFPTSCLPRSVDISFASPTLISQAESLVRVERSFDVQRWALHVEWPLMTRDMWAPIFAFLAAMRGRYGIFEFIPPGIAGRGVLTGAPAVDGSSQSGRSLETRGWTTSQTGIIKAGDFFRLGKKVYIADADANSDSNGDATLSIEPALVETPTDGASLYVANIPFRVSLIADTLESLYDYNGVYTLSVDMIEVA